jgi:hypothetical protein
VLLSEPKKVNRPYAPGLALRRDLLIAAGISEDVVNVAPPKGADEDDARCTCVRRNRAADYLGQAKPFPIRPGAMRLDGRWRLGLAVYAAFFFALINLRLIRHSAICTR